MNSNDCIPKVESSKVHAGCDAVEVFQGIKSRSIIRSWEIPFPKGPALCYQVFQNGLGEIFGVAVYRFSNSEARFVIRGELFDADDLRTCLNVAEDLGRQLGCSEIVTQEKMRPDWLGAGDVFKKCQFQQLDESWIFECPFKPFAERLNRIMRVLRRDGSIPEGARVTDLAVGQGLARAILGEALLMDGFDFDNRLKPGSTKYISAEFSQLVWIGKKLVGIMLVAPTGKNGIYEIPIRYIAPAYRKTWVNALLIYSCVKRGESVNATTIRFNANAKMHHETIRLAEQSGCTCIALSHRYGKQCL